MEKPVCRLFPYTLRQRCAASSDSYVMENLSRILTHGRVPGTPAKVHLPSEVLHDHLIKRQYHLR